MNADLTQMAGQQPLHAGSVSQAAVAFEPEMALPDANADLPDIPSYLKDTYHWAYSNPRNVRLLDHDPVVSIILWGQHARLQRAAFTEIEPGQRVLQPAAVYGSFSRNLAGHVGPEGRLDITDINPIQVSRCRRKLRRLAQVSIRLADARSPGGGLYDTVCCYFLMHELPDGYKRSVMAALLACLAPGGKLLIVDFHKPHRTHPARLVTGLVFDLLEPFAKSLWRHELQDFCSNPGDFTWRKTTYFGGLFQKVIVERQSRTTASVFKTSKPAR